ncbi:MAG TPA: substrate-binding domain-containing protein [Streptomyces sp.]|uniref:substrate-binding domain-containing protein n=1 Tax=Streptomyces sp. TaxID=1931 RepID=UPI002C245736|nr:substrate-binding domain-containing protein [Streptomyces sp.]HWU10720.1 substrate-binding domain-containing protein [Streptomyces sp.]
MLPCRGRTPPAPGRPARSRTAEDFSLAGHDNTALAALAPAQPTGVGQAGSTMGSCAVRMPIERVEGRRARAMRTSMTPRPVVRGTTSAPRGGQTWSGRSPPRPPGRPWSKGAPGGRRRALSRGPDTGRARRTSHVRRTFLPAPFPN